MLECPLMWDMLAAAMRLTKSEAGEEGCKLEQLLIKGQQGSKTSRETAENHQKRHLVRKEKKQNSFCISVPVKLLGN